MALVDLELTASPYDNGRPIGGLGAYEELRGKARFALDPKDAANGAVTDIDLATKAEDGRVHFVSDVRILRPADPFQRRRGLLLDVVNRGRPTTIRSYDMLDSSRDWLLSQGYTVVMCGWQHDVKPGGDALCIEVPEALQDGQPVTGRVLSVPVPAVASQVLSLADGDSDAYEAADLNEASATLSECDYPMAPGRLIPRDKWQFGRLQDGVVVPDASHLYYAEGFTPGHTYEVVYTTSGCQLTGAGFAATRDLVSFLRYGAVEAGNPCAGDIDYTLSFGSSQSGRFLKQFLYLGFNQDEQQRPVLDGIHAHIAGGRRIESNWRFGQPSYNGPYSMSGLFPFTDLDQEDQGRVDGVQHRAAAAGSLPKVVYTNSSCEYWGNYAALVHTALDGSDAVIPDNVRVFHLAGTQHAGGGLPVFQQRSGPRMTYYPTSTIDYRPLLRAALVNLDAWVSRGVEPPASRYPNVTAGTLVPRESLRQRFADLPGPGVPAHLVPFARLDFGKDAGESYEATQLPPKVGESYPEMVAALDADLNELGGLRVPDVQVPLATYTGWNPRYADIGGEDQPLRLQGSTMPFARTASERQAANDPRPSIEERYASRDAFLSQIRAAAQAMVDERLLLADDVEPIVASSGQRWDELTAPR